MGLFELVLGLLFAGALFALWSDRLGVPYPALLRSIARRRLVAVQIPNADLPAGREAWMWLLFLLPGHSSMGSEVEPSAPRGSEAQVHAARTTALKCLPDSAEKKVRRYSSRARPAVFGPLLDCSFRLPARAGRGVRLFRSRRHAVHGDLRLQLGGIVHPGRMREAASVLALRRLRRGQQLHRLGLYAGGQSVQQHARLRLRGRMQQPQALRPSDVHQRHRLRPGAGLRPGRVRSGGDADSPSARRRVSTASS